MCHSKNRAVWRNCAGVASPAGGTAQWQAAALTHFILYYFRAGPHGNYLRARLSGKSFQIVCVRVRAGGRAHCGKSSSG